MVMANTERVAKALDLLRDGLGPACEDTWRGFYGDGWLQQVNSKLHSPERQPSTGDSAFLFKASRPPGTRCSATGSARRCVRWCSRWPTFATAGRTSSP